MQRLADEGGGAGVLVEQHVFPGHEHIVENDDGIHLIKLVRQRIIPLGRAAGKAGAADVFHARRIHFHDAAQGIFGKLGIAPVGDGWLQESLIGIGRSGFIFGAANDDAGIGFLDHMDQHVRVLLLGRL